MKDIIKYLFAGFAAAMVIYFLFNGLPFSNVSLSRNEPSDLKNANIYYLAGENAHTIAERKNAFNNALKLYVGLERMYEPSLGNGRIYFAIGNTYFQLGKYPFAILYYYRALKLMPHNDSVKNNLDLALSKLKLQKEETARWYDYFNLSLPMRLILFFISGVGFLSLISTYIWLGFSWLKPAIYFFALVSVSFLGSALYTRFITPEQGVFIRASAFYRDASEQYAKISETPINPGTKVDILNQAEQGHWLKVRMTDGTPGYVPAKVIRII